MVSQLQSCVMQLFQIAIIPAEGVGWKEGAGRLESEASNGVCSKSQREDFRLDEVKLNNDHNNDLLV